MNSIGVDIGGSHISCCMFKHTNKVLLRDTMVYSKVDTNASKDEILSKWIYAISQTIEQSNAPFAGIGIAMPGPFDYQNGISHIRNVDKLNSLYGVNIKEVLADAFNIEPDKVRFINDASAFSIAEARLGKASAHSHCVAITLGTGFGSSFLINAHPIINNKNIPEGGFLYNQPYHGKIADEIFSTRGIVGHYKEVSGVVVKNVQQLCELANTDEKAREVLSRFGKQLGIFLEPYLTAFSAEVLVIGGNIAKASAYFQHELIAQLPNIEVYISSMGEEAAIIGSALLLDDKYYTELVSVLEIM